MVNQAVLAWLPAKSLCRLSQAMLNDDITINRAMRAGRRQGEMPRFQRVKVSLLGRYMLADRREFPCQVLEMSPGDAVVIAPISGGVGEKVIAYVDHIGRVEGTILDSVEGGFVMDVTASDSKRDKMAAQLTWHATKDLFFL